ncbi:MAG: creatininase family protein [Alphaproteobacteria bacterium]|nr:creatininase family protein [Alphaproteobacteria bacterium]
MKLQFAAWPEVEEYLTTNAGIIVPIGSTEQHGPTGLMGTDYIIPSAMAKAISERTGICSTPPVTFGMAQHHLGFPGTISLRPSTYVSVLVDVMQSLARHGFRRIVFLNGHGGNIAPALTAMNEFYAGTSFHLEGEHRDVLCKLISWWMPPKTAAEITEIFGDGDGAHATASEIAVTQFLHSKYIKQASPDLPQARKGTVSDIHNAYDYRHRFADGRIGSDVRLCSPESGQRVFEVATREIADECAAFFSAKG